MVDEKPKSRLRRWIGRAVAVETAYSFYERAHQLWENLPQPIRSGIKLAMIWLISWLAARKAVVLGWADSLSEFTLIQVGIGFLLISVWVLIALVVRHNRDRTTTERSGIATSPLPGLEEYTTRDAVERLREAMKGSIELLEAIHYFYFNDVFRDSWWPASSVPGLAPRTPNGLIEDLFRTYELRRFETAKNDLERSDLLRAIKEPRRLTDQEFTAFLEKFCASLLEYSRVAQRVRPIVASVPWRRHDLYSSQNYRTLFKLHNECIPRLRDASERADLRPLRGVLPEVELENPTLESPRIILVGEDAFHVKRVEFRARNKCGEERTFIRDVLTVQLMNAKVGNARGVAARGLTVEFTCKNPGLDLPWISARLDDSIQPSFLRPGEKAEREFRLEPGETRPLNLVVKAPESSECYLFNNESYEYPGAQKPEWKMTQGEHRCLIKVGGVDIQETFECFFLNLGEGVPLIVKSFGHLPEGLEP